MTLASIFFLLSCTSMAVSCALIFRMVWFLNEQGHEINWMDIRSNTNRYLRMYRQSTLEKYGKVGKAYYLTYCFFSVGVLCFEAMIFFKIMEV